MTHTVYLAEKEGLLDVISFSGMQINSFILYLIYQTICTCYQEHWQPLILHHLKTSHCKLLGKVFHVPVDNYHHF